MRRKSAPSPAPDLSAFARGFGAGPNPDAEDILFSIRRIQAFGMPKREVRWPTFAETQADAPDGEIRAVAHQYSVPAAALFALAETDGRRSRDTVEANAFRLKRHLDAGKSLSEALAPHVLARAEEICRGEP